MLGGKLTALYLLTAVFWLRLALQGADQATAEPSYIHTLSMLTVQRSTVPVTDRLTEGEPREAAHASLYLL